MSFNFGEVLSQALKIGWRHKILWLYQILPSFVLFLTFPLLMVTNPFILTFMPSPWSDRVFNPWVIAISLSCMIVLVLPFMIALGMAQVATTLGALRADGGAEKLRFRELWKESRPYFWRLVGLYTAIGAIWLAMIVLYTPLIMTFANNPSSITMIGLALLTLVFIPIFVVSFIVMELAQAAIVAYDMGVKESISSGWNLFRSNVFTVVLLFVILFAGMNVVNSIASFPITIPMGIVPVLFARFMEEPSLWMPLIILAILLLILVFSSVVQGILTAFFQVAWALTYLRLAAPKEAAPVIIEANA